MIAASTLLRKESPVHCDASGHILLAYLDPGSGSLAVQFLIAALLGGAVAFRSVVFRPLRWVLRIGRRNNSAISAADVT